MTSRRAMLAAMGGLPFTRPDQHYEPPDGAIVPGSRSSVFKGKLVIVSGTGFTGVFVYSPGPGAGHLADSIAASSGTDPASFGSNAYLAGITSYKTSGSPVFASQMFQGNISFYQATTEAGPWSLLTQIASNASGQLLLARALAGDIIAQTHLQATQGIAVTNGATIDVLTVTAGAGVTGGITADTEAISSGQAGGLLLQVTNTTGSPTAPNFRITSQTAGDPALAIRVAGDTFNRALLDDNGTTGGRLRAGSGAIAPDVALYRAAANQWAMDYLAFNNAGSAETWQTVGGTGAAFAGTWANAAAPGVNLKYRRNAAPYQSVHWVGRVTNTVAQAAGSNITAAVAAAYRPSNTHDITCFNITSGAVVRVSIGSTGVLTCQSAIAANDVIGIPDVQIGLDA